MSEMYDRYVAEIAGRLLLLPSDAGTAVMLAACERMFFVFSRPEVRQACDRSWLRRALDAMWVASADEGGPMSVPDEFEIESLSDELVLMATDAILMMREALTERSVLDGRLLSVAVELANAVDAAQDPEGVSDRGSLDAFLVDAGSCASIEVSRQLQDLDYMAEAEAGSHRCTILRTRSALQDITCGLPL